MPRKYHTISHSAARELIYSQRVNGRGAIFGIAFRRRTTSDDELRQVESMEVVYARFGVRKGLKHAPATPKPVKGRTGHTVITSAAYDRASRDLVGVYVVNRKNRPTRGGDKGFRSIPLDKIRWLKLDGVTYKVGEAAPVQH